MIKSIKQTPLRINDPYQQIKIPALKKPVLRMFEEKGKRKLTARANAIASRVLIGPFLQMPCTLARFEAVVQRFFLCKI